MAVSGSGPKFTMPMSRNGVPYGGILFTGGIGLFGMGLALVPRQAFEIVLNIAAVGMLVAWGTIVVCQLKLYQMTQRGEIERPSFGCRWRPTAAT